LSENFLLFDFWERLKVVTSFTVRVCSCSQDQTGWNGKGHGEVFVQKEGGDILIFREQGSWLMQQNRTVMFSNVLRWTLDRSAGMISLEHLRFGLDNPVFLCCLRSVSDHFLRSVAPHVCKEDIYRLQVTLDQTSIRLYWRVTGPSKNEAMAHHYNVYPKSTQV
jgi:Family of unknown function (DUF6314)